MPQSRIDRLKEIVAAECSFHDYDGIDVCTCAPVGHDDIRFLLGVIDRMTKCVEELCGERCCWGPECHAADYRKDILAAFAKLTDET